MYRSQKADIDAGSIYNKLSAEDNTSLEDLVHELLADIDEGFNSNTEVSNPPSNEVSNSEPMDQDMVDIIDTLLKRQSGEIGEESEEMSSSLPVSLPVSEQSNEPRNYQVHEITTEKFSVPITSGDSFTVKQAQEQMDKLKMERGEKVYTELKTATKPPSYAEGLKLLKYPVPQFDTPQQQSFATSSTPTLQYEKTTTRISFPPMQPHQRSASDIDQLQGGWGSQLSVDSIGGPMRTTKSAKVSPTNTPYASTQSSRSHSPNFINRLSEYPNMPNLTDSRNVAGPSRPVKKIKKETKERIHKCPHMKDGQPCQQAFFRPDELKRHVKIHTGEKPYKCSYCIRAFARSDHLKTHTRTHTGEKPYNCKYCDKKFARSDERLRHHQVHEKKIKKEQQNKQEGTMPYVSQPYNIGANQLIRASSQGNIQLNNRYPIQTNCQSYPSFGQHSPPAYHQVQPYSNYPSNRGSPRRAMSPMNSYPPTPVYLTDSSSTGSLHHCQRCNFANCQCTIKRET